MQRLALHESQVCVRVVRYSLGRIETRRTTDKHPTLSRNVDMYKERETGAYPKLESEEAEGCCCFVRGLSEDKCRGIGRDRW